MTLIDDRELLVIEPSVFEDAADVGTALITGSDGVVSGSSLTSAGSDFEDAGIDSGHAIVVDGSAGEVVSRESGTELTVSLPRAQPTGPPIEMPGGSGLSFTVVSFARQIEQAQSWVLSSLGIDEEDPASGLDETAVVNDEAVGELIALRALLIVFDAAAAKQPADSSLSSRAALYRQRAGEAMHRTKALLDTDGDGVTDAARPADVVQMKRT